MRRLIELSRFAVAVPAVTSIVASFVLMGIGVWEVVMSIIHLMDASVSIKLTVVAILTAVDTFLLATVSPGAPSRPVAAATVPWQRPGAATPRAGRRRRR